MRQSTVGEIFAVTNEKASSSKQVTQNLLVLAVSFIVIAISADKFVVGAARTAQLLNVRPLVVGVIIVGFGTGLPELMTAIVASSNNNATLGISSVMGSTVVNTTLVLGTLGLLSSPRIASSVLKKEGTLQVIGVIFFGLVVTFAPNRLAYTFLILILIVAISYILRNSGKADSANEEFESETQTKEQYCSWSLPVALLVTVVGLAIVLASAEILIGSATTIAGDLGLSKAIIGVTLVALGTSLPELTTAIAAARRGHSDLVIGNVFGANLFNVTGVAGIAGLISPGRLQVPHLSYDIVFLVVVALTAWLFLASSRRLSRAEGFALIVLYLVWLGFVSI